MSKSTILVLLLIAALLVVIKIMGSGADGDPAVPNLAPPSEVDAADLVALAGPTLSGEAFDLAGHRGSVVLIDFWGPWCPPCRQTMPNVIAIQARHAAEGLVVVGAPVNSDPANVKAYATEHGMPWVQLDPALADQAANSFGIQGVPTLVVIDRQGRRRASLHPGDREQLERVVRQLLAE